MSVCLTFLTCLTKLYHTATEMSRGGIKYSKRKIVGMILILLRLKEKYFLYCDIMTDIEPYGATVQVLLAKETVITMVILSHPLPKVNI